jgi:hypothetical protein
MITLVRFSDTGFQPLYQTKMKEAVDFVLKFSKAKLPTGLTE